MLAKLLLPVTTALLTTLASAQCFDQTQIGNYVGNGDDVLFPQHLPLGLAFPMAGGIGSGTYTHCVVCTNGWLALTDGTSYAALPGPFDYGSVAFGQQDSLFGPAGSSPRIAPYWGDLILTAGGVYFAPATSPGGSARITWSRARDFGIQSEKTFQVELFADGTVRFHYSSGMTNQISYRVVGLSSANGNSAMGQHDLVPGPSVSTTPGMAQAFTTIGEFDAGGYSLAFTAAGNGFQEAVVCGPIAASHSAYGTGCYSLPAQGFYQYFATAALANATLQNQAMQLVITGSRYTASWLPYGGAGYMQPAGNASYLPTSDDGGHTIPLPSPLPTPGGQATHLRIHHNGVVHVGNLSSSSHDGTWTPSGAGFAASPQAGFYAWHDFRDTELGSSNIECEQFGTTFCVTWRGVEGYANPEQSNPSHLQFQFDLVTGTVRYVFAGIDSNSTSLRGSAWLVGMKGFGVMVDPGSTPLPTSLPRAFAFNPTPPLQLSAGPAPVSTPSAGTLVVYTQSFVPETAPGSGYRVGLTLLSLGQNLAGLDLGFLGMPGCAMHLASIDASIPYAGTSAQLSTPFVIPPGVPYGTRVYAQSCALTQPGVMNPFGATTSNAIASFVSYF